MRDTKIWSPLNLYGGINLADKEWKIADNQTSKTLNMWYNNGELGKRYGQKYINYSEVVETPCYNAYKYLYQGKIIKHCGTKLYSQDPTTGVTTELITGLSNKKGSFFKFNGKIYYINGDKYYQYDGVSVGNLMGIDGDCDDITKFAASNITLSLDSTKQSSNYALRATLTNTTGTVKYKLPTLDTSKYYLISAYVRNGNATNITLSKDATGGGTIVAATSVTDTTQFIRSGVVIQPSALNQGNYVTFTVNGASTNYAYIDSIMINVITSDDYAAGVAACLTKYPYTNLMGAIQVSPYIPTVVINRTPTGGGSANENYNRLGTGFKNSFNGNGAAVAYTLTDANLDSTLVTATVGGVPKVETTDFTVNRTTGIITFTAAPASGTNNVIITAYKTIQSDIDTILKCLYAIPFGGQNDNRVFFAGNGTGYYYWTGITTSGIDPTYFPYNNYNIIGLTDENINGFGKQYDTLCIFKPREIYGVTYTWDGSTGIFDTFPVNAQIGCDCPGTIQTINNNLVWMNSYGGIYTLVGTAVESQRNVFPISRNINPRLLLETALKTANSVDFNGKYWLNVGDKVYLWDYFISPYTDTGNPEQSAKLLSWWYFDNIDSSCFIIDDQSLYYVNETNGKSVQFITSNDGTQFYDFGVGYSSMYRIPLRDFGNGINEFDVLEMWVDCRGDTRTLIQVVYVTSDDINGDPSMDYIEVGSFSYDTFSYDTFTYQVMGYKETFPLAPMEKKIDLFGVEFSNDDGGRDMNISDIQLLYRLGKRK